MSLDADYLVERQRLKRRLLLWRIVALVIIGGVALSTFTDIKNITGGDHIARLNVSGILVDDLDREQALDELKSDAEVLALIVRIDSPGGTIVGGESLYHQLRAVGTEKPVVAVMGSMATSAGYMTALGTDHLFAREGSLTGSIGVLMQTADVTGLLEKIGVKPDTIKSGPLKAQPNPLEVTTPAARQAIKDVVMDMYGMFVEMVAERRNMDLGQAKALADGRVYSGRQALANGLIDAIGSETEAVDWLEKTREIPAGLAIRNVVIERPGQAWQNFINGLVGKTLFSERLTLDGLISLWHPERW
ncbi:MAG: signal peptide peptidase SppA [Rhodospirillaceae bacterium]|jgi:protease IV|nr:signal peptide peptidase SppA [Rhodospirillaceae bacterium]MBT5244978.1 signal peptide peptidase SppA [Rhodospirillaceae bacterium]MBT5562633.1 signal peptide peptidase SppA [Rhodospirillaceae bacterium]MBT6243059.1 signal peptide peptidase SppA [Rhodospirillaceae bacterium]MBT7136954.1 signal peptide peptidase SppA [Rhodospirillaceae bacterium]